MAASEAIAERSKEIAAAGEGLAAKGAEELEAARANADEG